MRTWRETPPRQHGAPVVDSARALYGLLDHDLDKVIEIYSSRDVADRELAEILHDEPHWAWRFEIVIVDLGGAEPTVASAG